MSIRGVLFDLDGTLTLPGALDFPAIKTEMGCPVDHPILEYLETQPRERREVLMEVLEQKEEAAAEVSRPNEGAEACLRMLKGRGMYLGILTRNSERSVRKVIEKFEGVTVEDFAAVITRDCSLPKPHPDGVLEAARRMGVSPGEVLMVGDFRFDVLAGKAAGAHTVLLTNGGARLMAPEDPDPDHTITRLEELPGLLEVLEAG